LLFSFSQVYSVLFFGAQDSQAGLEHAGRILTDSALLSAFPGGILMDSALLSVFSGRNLRRPGHAAALFPERDLHYLSHTHEAVLNLA
jgi:hypothetical protein